MCRALTAVVIALLLLADSPRARARVIDGPAGFVVVSGTELATVLPGASVGEIDAIDKASVSVMGGQIGSLMLYFDSTATIQGGDLIWIQAQHNSFVRLSNAQSIGSLVLWGPDARAEIVADQVTYSRGTVQGIWANGAQFSFAAYRFENPASATMPANITIVPIPEPGGAALVAFGLLLLWARNRHIA